MPFEAPEKFTTSFYLDLLRNLASGLPYAVAKYRSPQMRREISRRAQQADVDLVVCDFLAPSLNVPRDLPCPTVLFQHNVEASIWKRHVDVAGSRVKKAYVGVQWRRMRKFEGRECRRYDRVIAVSDADRAAMEREYGAENVAIAPTGVDTEFFHPSDEVHPVPGRLVFTGSMDWLPNRDAIEYFLNQVFPLIRSEIGGVTLDVVGRHPGEDLKGRAKRDDALTVTGFVDDVRPYIERAAVYIVPLRVGGGTRLKIYEAMAMEKPIVSTTIGAEGLPLRHGRDLLVADSPRDFAREVLRLLARPERARELGRAAAARARSEFGWENVARRFAEVCGEVVGGGNSDAPAPGSGPSAGARAESALKSADQISARSEGNR